MKKSGIYTKSGDKGDTALIGGRRISKHHPRIEAYGSVDELMAHTAMLHDLVDDPLMKQDLVKVMDAQMRSSSVLATDFESIPEGLPVLGEEDVAFLENRMDEMDASLDPLTSFLLPGGLPAISQAHIARTVCRRTERCILRLHEESEIDPVILQFYNRLSDYFFVISRKIASQKGIKQQPWKGGL